MFGKIIKKSTNNMPCQLKVEYIDLEYQNYNFSAQIDNFVDEFNNFIVQIV